MLYSIQYLRAIAATMVAAYHASLDLPAGSALHGLLKGQAGVDIFFVISGFLMWQTTARPVPPSPSEFMRKRLRRIVPLYWIVTLAMFAMPAISGTIAGSTVYDPMHLVASLLFIPYPYPADPSAWFPVYVPGWTINYEMFFYALFALALFTKSPRIRLAAIVGALVALAAAGGVFGTSGRIGWYLSPMLLEFVAGILIAAYFTSRSPVPLPVAVTALAIGVAGLALVPADTSFPRAFTWGVPAALICLGAASLEWHGRVPKTGALEYLGDASYSLYLTHPFAIGAIAIVWSKMHMGPLDQGGYAYLAVALAGSMIVAILTYEILERPLSAPRRKYAALRP